MPRELTVQERRLAEGEAVEVPSPSWEDEWEAGLQTFSERWEGNPTDPDDREWDWWDEFCSIMEGLPYLDAPMLPLAQVVTVPSDRGEYEVAANPNEWVV